MAVETAGIFNYTSEMSTTQSTTSLGTAYEQFVQSVYQAIIDSSDVNTIKVQHNVVVEGRSGCSHQIDVYWEFEVAGKKYNTAIECKSYNTRVSIGKIRDFYGVLIDVPNLTGIFATKKGFQSGAKTYAEHYSIDLKEVREPSDDDWEGRVKNIELKVHVRNMNVTSLQPKPTKSFLESLDENEEVKLNADFMTNEPIVFRDSDGAGLSKIDLDDLVPLDFEEGKGLKFLIELEAHTFRVGEMEIPITGIEYVYDISFDTETIKIEGEQLAKAIVKDVAAGGVKFIDKKNKVRDVRGTD